jgi:hypothetical protein
VARSDREKARHLVHIFNQVLTQELDFSAEIVAIANKISDGDWKDIAKFVGDNKNEEDTINTFLRKPVSVEFVRLLQQKNIITERNTSKYIETNRSKKNYGLFNRFGRRLVSELFLGRLIASPELLDLMGDGVINLVETIAPYIIVSSCCFSAWNLMEDFRVALGVLAQVKQPSKPEQRKEVLRSVLKQADMFGGGGYTEVQASERRKLLFHYLYAFVNAPKKLAAGFKDYAKRASQTYEEQFALPGLVPASGEQESFSQLLLSFGARVDSEPGSPSGFVIQGDPMGGELHQRAPNPLRKIQFQLPQGKGRKPLELGGTYDTETGMYTPAQQTPAAYRERLQGRIVETESDAKRAWRAMNLLTAMEGVTEHADWRQAATVLQESITHGQMSLDTFEFIKLLLFGVTEPVDETPLEVESQVPDALVDVVDTLPEEPVSNESPEDGLYTYDGRTFRIDRSLQPGNLVFYHSISGDKPIIISESEERQGNQIYSLGSGSMRPLTLWRVRGAEMTADGWREMQRTIEAEPAFDRVLRGAFTGFQSFAQIYPQLHPIEFLEMHQGRLQEQRAYEQAESREEVEREGLRKAEVGLWFEQEISRTIAEGGWIPDTVEASALRSWFKQNGLSVSLKVRRYSMASGLDFSLREPSSGSRETLRRMTDIRPDEIGILAHNRTGQGDILIKYPYVDSLATLLASRFKVYVDKKGEGHFTITPAGLRIAAGESISSMFRGKDPLQISGNESPEVLRYFAADLAMRALVSMEQLGLEAEPETKQAIQAIQQHAAHVSSDDLLATTALLRTISPGNSGERKVVGMLLLAAQSDIQSSIHEVVQMAGAYMLEHVGMGYDEDWMVDRLHFLLDLWNASGIRGLQLLFEGSHPMGSGPAYGQGIS